MPAKAKSVKPDHALDVAFPDTFPAINFEEIAKRNAKNGKPLPITPETRERVKTTIDRFMSQLKDAYRILQDVAVVPDDARTFRNTLEALDDFYVIVEEAVNWPGFYAYVHPDPFVRAVGEEIDKFSSQFLVEVGSSRTLYRALKTLDRAKPKLSAEERYLLDENIRDFEDGGVGLPDKKRDRFKALSKELSDAAIDFSSNLRDYSDTLPVSPDQLAGMDSDYIERLEKTGDGKFILTLDYPVFLPYMDYGRDETVRKELLKKFRNRAKDKNVDLLLKITKLRIDRTKLLGKKSYAESIISRRMARTPKIAMDFLEDVRRRVDRKAKEEVRELTELKREVTGNSSAGFEQWDRNFYSKIITRRKFDYDPQKVKEYFQTDRVTQALLDISQKIYGIKFKKSPGAIPLWHEDAIHYDVYSDGKMIGEFYMDLYPRPNKYKHAAAWGLRPHKIFPDGRVQLPISAIVANFQKPMPGKPSLLSFDDVETFFHEFGHLIHGILSTTRFAQVSGTRVMRDFVEAPSQMFEKWVHDTAVLSTFAKHYQTGETIPAALVDRIVKSRNVVSGIETQRQLFYGIYDLTLHTVSDKNKIPDVVQLWFRLKEEVEKMPEIPETNGPAGFDHLMGYGAGYYGYLWSKMIAANMYEYIRDHGGLMNPEQGKRLRRIILSQGGSRHPDELVREFLGQPLKIEPFLRELDIEE